LETIVNFVRILSSDQLLSVLFVVLFLFFIRIFAESFRSNSKSNAAVRESVEKLGTIISVLSDSVESLRQHLVLREEFVLHMDLLSKNLSSLEDRLKDLQNCSEVIRSMIYKHQLGGKDE